MPGRFFLTSSLSEIAAFLNADVPDMAITPRYNVAPGQAILVYAPDRGLCDMRWGIIPVGRVNARGRPVMETIINARSETVFEKSAYAGVRRCLVPANGWYEWTGKAGRKTAWRIRPAAAKLMAFAAIFDTWNAPDGTALAQVATITCPPSADVEKIHHRMGVIIQPSDFEQWLHGDPAETGELMVPTPTGYLCAETAEDIDWQGP